MTTSAQRGHLAFCTYATPQGDTAFDPTLATKFMWQRHKATEVSVAPQEFVDVLPQEVGENIYNVGTYSMGAYVGGTFTVDARLKNSVGHLLYAVAGSYTASPSGPTYSGGTIFKPATDSTVLPWMALRRYIPNESGTGTTEYSVDCVMNTLTLTLPQMGIMSAQAAIVGRKPYWDSAHEVTAGQAFEDTSTFAMSGNTSVALSAFDPELGTGGAAGKFAGGQIIFSNGTTTPQQEMILGSYFPDTFMPLTRNVSIRLIYKWKDAGLYKKLWTQALTGTGGIDREYKISRVVSPVDIVMNTPTVVTTGSNPYRLAFHSDYVEWTMSSPQLVPGRMIQTELIGTVKAAPSGSDTWFARLDNGVTYTFGS